jgi:hypothetical protein
VNGPLAVGASYALKVSNGQYGSEEIGMTILGHVDTLDDAREAFGGLVDELRDKVIAKLQQSHYVAVRDSLANYVPKGDIDDTPF